MFGASLAASATSATGRLRVMTPDCDTQGIMICPWLE